MPIVRNIKYRHPLRGSDAEKLAQLAEAMVASNQTALSVELDRLNVRDFSFLRFFQGITHLSIKGGALRSLQEVPESVLDLCLLSVELDELSALSYTANLKVLDVRNCRIASLAGLDSLSNLRIVEFFATHGLDELTAISWLSGLRWIKICDSKTLEGFPNLSNLLSLRRVILEGCSGIKDLSSLATAPALEYLIIIEAEGLTHKHFTPFRHSQTPRKILPGIALMNEEEFDKACNLLGEKAITGYYGDSFEFFDFDYNDDGRFTLRAS